jgi:uncharacterized protein (TIGR01777 family)
MEKIKKVLITGGYGLIGKKLSQLLIKKGYEVSMLSRSHRSQDGVSSFRWDVEKQYIDPKALDVDCIIHLAGENIAASRWPKARKRQILDSRVKSTALLYNSMQSLVKRPQLFLAASATGYYGGFTNEHVYLETDSAASDFLGQTCLHWEASVDRMTELGMRVVKLRTGVVLSQSGGALEKMRLPVLLGIGSALGSGNQYFPWIHIDDLCAMYIHALENKDIHGAYNAVAPESINNRTFTETIAKVLHRPFFFPAVPAFALRLLFGELAVVLLEGSSVSAEKIMRTGFSFRYKKAHDALQNLLKK